MPTIRTCFEILRGRGAEISVLELGATRSFTSGFVNTEKFDQNPQTWDWGAGCFTVAIKILIPDCELVSVDPNKDAIKVSKILLAEIGESATFHQVTSTDFLNTTKESFDLIYMDHAEAGQDDACAILHRNDAGLILKKDLLKPGGLVLIDDVKTPFNKGMYSIPYFEECGLSRLSGDSYQCLFRKEF